MAPQHKTHFQLFDLPESFVIDAGALAERYRLLQREYHPDRFAAAPEQEQRLAVQMAARINDAYQVLKSPLSRGSYLLSLRGMDVNMESNRAMSMEFLQEQMEYRERMEEVRESGDPLMAVSNLTSELRSKSRDYEQQLAQCFESGQEQALERAVQLVRELQFINKLREELERLEETLL